MEREERIQRSIDGFERFWRMTFGGRICKEHPDRTAVMCDLDSEGNKVPLCESCYRARQGAIHARVFGQGLITGGVKG